MLEKQKIMDSTGIDEQAYARLLALSLEDISKRIPPLTESIHKNEFESARQQLHTLRSSFVCIGATSCSDASLKLHAAIKENKTQEVPPLLDGLLDEISLINALAAN